MSLTDQQYNEILRKYERRRLKNLHDLDERTAEVYKKIPQIQTINGEIASLSVNAAKARLLSGTGSKEQVSRQISELSERKKQLLKKNGYPEDYLSMHYHCSKCKDTGYVGNEKCSCLQKQIISLLYEQSNLSETLKHENFSTFREDYYPDSMIDKKLGISAHRNILNILHTCHNFVDTFQKDYSNLLIYGASGVGKTFLTNCIAKELIEQSYSVIYISSIRFFKILGDASFRKGEHLNEQENIVFRDFHSCDLLIIDDLGTEVTNTFTASALFNCINERALNRKPVIISTNLELPNLRDMYSDRIFSRIVSNYKILKLFGNDLRIMKTLK